jgi:hypothetical protein
MFSGAGFDAREWRVVDFDQSVRNSRNIIDVGDDKQRCLSYAYIARVGRRGRERRHEERAMVVALRQGRMPQCRRWRW